MAGFFDDIPDTPVAKQRGGFFDDIPDTPAAKEEPSFRSRINSAVGAAADFLGYDEGKRKAASPDALSGPSRDINPAEIKADDSNFEVTKRPLAPGKEAKKGLETGYVGLKNLWESNAILKDATLASSMGERLDAFDKIDAGATNVPRAIGLAYQQADATGRAKLRQQTMGELTNRKEFVAASMKTVRQYQSELQKARGSTADLTDIENVTDFANWLAFNGAAGVASMAPLMLAAVATGPAAPLVVGTMAFGMATGEINNDRIKYAQDKVDEQRFRNNPDRYDDAMALENQRITDNVSKNVGSTVAAAVPFAAMDALFGPVGSLLTGQAGRAVRSGARGVAREIGKDTAQEFVTGGAQESIKIGTERAIGETDETFTAANAKRVLNAAAAEAAGGFVGGAARVGFQSAIRETSVPGMDPTLGADDLRPSPGTIPPADPAPPTPAEQAVQADIENLRTSLQREPTAAEVADAASQRAMNEIGSAPSVDDAIGAAQAAVRAAPRAVTLDDANLLSGVSEQTGITTEEMAQRAIPQGVDAAQVTPEIRGAGPAPLTDTVTWTGRRGDGYATIEDATRALKEKQATRPSFDWSTQQNADGRFVLQGVKRDTSLQASYPTQQAAEAALVASGVPAGSAQVQARGERFTIAPTQPKESIRELRNQADQVNALAGAIAAQGEDASNIQLYTAEPRDDVYSEEVGGRSVRPPRPGVAGAADTVAEIGRITQVAFGSKPIPVTGLGKTYGVQYKGTVFVDVAELAAGNTYGSSVEAMAIQTIGHETTHNLEKSTDPQDRADYAILRDAVLSNAKDGVVDRRVAAENKGQTYGENEVVADVSGDFWLDPKFWNRLYDLDPAAMRRIVYKFMEGATKLIEVVKGSRLDADRFINNVAQVREVAAQVWASKAKRGDSLFAGEDTGTVSRSESTIEANDGPAKQPASAGRDARGSRPEDRAASGRQNAAEQSRQASTGAEGNAAAPRGKDGRLDGAPSVPGFSGPDPRIVSVAEQYARDNGIALKPQAAYAKIDPVRAKRIANAYTQMANAPQDPEVRAAYQNLIEQTVAQYRALEDAGYKFWFIDIDTQAGQDYVSTPWNAMRDMRANQSMGVFPSEEGFGSSDLDVSSNPLLAETGVMWPAGSPNGPMQRVLANDMFRAVHDAFGHGMEGAGFRAEGEENAWQAHVRLFTGSAVAAITSETRGQNSWVNFGPSSEANQTAQAIDTVFADQKVGLMPAWTWSEGRVGDEVTSKSTNREDNERSRSSESARSTEGPNRVRDGSGRPDEASRSRSGVELAADGGQDRPSYGQARDGATSAVGFHYSKQARTNLVSAFYGTGLKGLEAKRLEGQRDIIPRIYFYVDKGRGVNPESGVGGVAHSVSLSNLYDVSKDSLGIVSGTRGMEGDRQNNWERAVMQAGFDGYLVVDDILPQNYAVLVGKHTVPVAQANPTRGDGKANVKPAEKKIEQTRVSGKELVRRPQGPEVMQVIAAMRAGIEQAAPSFKMEFGEARVLASEAVVADTVLATQPGGFAFGEVASRSSAFAESDDTPDNAISGMEVREQAIYTPPAGFADIESMADALRAELAKDQALLPNLSGQAPTAQAVKDAGIHPEDAFDMTGALEVYSDDSAAFQIPEYARSVMRNTIIRGKSGSLLVSVASRRHSTFVEIPGLSDAQVEKYAARQIAGAILTDQGHDIADAQSKGMVLKIAATWKKVASMAGAFKLPAAKTKSTDFDAVAKEMGAFKGYDVETLVSDGSGFIIFTRQSDGKVFSASVRNTLNGMETCTVSLAGSGGLGTEYYAVLGRLAENLGVAFNADPILSGVNAYRRTEQAMSYALKSGRTDVLLPGPQNRVYGFDETASTPEAHDRNISRLALAGLRNVEELMPEVRQLKYRPADDQFFDANGRDAENTVTQALADTQARAFGLGRSTIARAVITGQILAGESIQAESFKSPIAYSLASAEMDAPMGEAWGDSNDLNPNLERFIAGSTVVDKDGNPTMMFHGTAQDIQAFRPKQAGAVFLTDNPNFAEQFADTSATWMRTNWQKVLTPEQQEQAKAQAIKSVMSDEYMPTTKRQQIRQAINEEKFSDDEVAYRIYMQVDRMMPSGQNIMPVFARVTSPFDYRNKADVDSVVFTLWDQAGEDDGNTLEITPVKVGAGSSFYSQRKLHDLISSGMWDIIESPEVQAVIKDTLGHDGFYVKEMSQVNLAVYDPKMVKSVFNSTYDTSTDDISRSRADVDTPAFRNWFGDSKVVDADGKPMVVYHGTTSSFDSFDPALSDSKAKTGAPEGSFFFTEKPDVASSYTVKYQGDFSATAHDGGNVMPVFLSIKKPLKVNAKGESWREILYKGEYLDINEIAKIAKDSGKYDGVIVSKVRDKGVGNVASKMATTYVAFNPTQIKSSIGNNGNFDPANPDISRSRVGNQFTLEDETGFQKSRRKLQDYFLRVREVQTAVMGQGGTVTEQTDTYSAEVLSHGRKNALLEDFSRGTVQPMMKKLVKQGIEMHELSLYAYAKHAEERNKRIASIDPRTPDGGSGMKTADANTILAAVAASGNQAKYDDLHGDLMAVVQTNRLVMLDEGLITQDEFNALDGMYQNYIPLRGFEVVDEENRPTGRSAGQGFNVRGAETVRALGRKTRAGQLMENVFADYQRTVVRSEHNQVAKVFLNFVLQNPDAKLWEIDATSTRKSLDRQTGRIARNTVIEKGEDTIAVKVKGREVYIQIKDPLLARAMRKSHTDETGELASDLMRSVGLYTTLLRNTLTRYNPEFAVVNALRDIGFGTAAMVDVLGEKGAAKFAVHYPGAVLVSARNQHNTLDPAARDWDRWFTEYRAAGGITGGFYQRNVEDITEDIRGLMLEAGAEPKNLTERLRHNAVTRMVAKAGRILEYAGSVSENAARVSAYRTAREMGKTASQSAIIAKNLTTNFDRKGEYGQMLNSLYVFFNAAMQGTHRTVQMFKNPKVLGYLGGVTAGAVGLALAGALAGGDDPDDGMAYWDKIPAFVKERNIIIMLPPDSQIEGAEEVGTKGRYLLIPVQYGLNIFPVIGYGIADFIRNQQDASRGATAGQVGIRFTSAFLGSFNPFGGAVDVTSGSSMAQAVMPSIFDPVVQFTTGTNAFGRDSAPFKSPFDAKPDSQNSNVRQSGGPAERVAQYINEVTGGSDYESGAIDVSAGTLENVVRALTGGTGIFLYDTLTLADKSLERAAGGDPDLFIRDIPLARKVYGETAGDIDQGLFYERRKQIQEARSVEKGANEAGVDITDPKKLALASLSKDAGKYTKYLAEIRREMKDVQTDTEMTKGDRKLKLRELRAERDRLTADFNRDFTDVMREELNAK